MFWNQNNNTEEKCAGGAKKNTQGYVLPTPPQCKDKQNSATKNNTARQIKYNKSPFEDKRIN